MIALAIAIIVLGLCVDNGLSNIARAISNEKENEL